MNSRDIFYSLQGFHSPARMESKPMFFYMSLVCFGGYILVYLSDFRLFCGFSGVLKSAEPDSVWSSKRVIFGVFFV